MSFSLTEGAVGPTCLSAESLAISIREGWRPLRAPAVSSVIGNHAKLATSNTELLYPPDAHSDKVNDEQGHDERREDTSFSCA